MGGNRPQPAIHQVKVKKMRVEGIRIPHLQDGELRPYASVRVGVKADEAVTNRSVSNVGGVFYYDAGYSQAEWNQTHVLTFHTPLEKSKVYIDVFNDKDSSYANGSLIGSACYDLSKHVVELYSMEKPEIEFGECKLELPAIGDNDEPFVNGYICFQVYVSAL